MTESLIDAANELAEALVAENAALEALDLARAADMLEAKQRVTERFAAVAPPAKQEERQTAALLTRVRALAEENRRLLDRAIAVQGRVLKIVVEAAAMPEARALQYGATGAQARPAYTSPVALSARA